MYKPIKSDGVMPIKIREDLKVYFANIPHNLTQKEADKIIRVIKALTSEE